LSKYDQIKNDLLKYCLSWLAVLFTKYFLTQDWVDIVCICFLRDDQQFSDWTVWFVPRYDRSQNSFLNFLRFLPVVSFPKHFFVRNGIGFVKQRFLHHIQLLSQRADKNLSKYDQIKNDLLKYCLSWLAVLFLKYFLTQDWVNIVFIIFLHDDQQFSEWTDWFVSRYDRSQDNFVNFFRFLPMVLFPKHFFVRNGIGFVKQRFSHHIQLLSQRADKNLSKYDQIKNYLLKYCLSWLAVSFPKYFLTQDWVNIVFISFLHDDQQLSEWTDWFVPRYDRSEDNLVNFLRFLPVVSFPKHFFVRNGEGFVKQRFSHHIQLLSQRADKNLSKYDQIKNYLLKYCLSWLAVLFPKYFWTQDWVNIVFISFLHDDQQFSEWTDWFVSRYDRSQDNFVNFFRFLPMVLFPKHFIVRNGIRFVKQRFSHHIQLLSQRADKNLSKYDQIKNYLLKYCLSWLAVLFPKYFWTQDWVNIVFISFLHDDQQLSEWTDWFVPRYDRSQDNLVNFLRFLPVVSFPKHFFARKGIGFVKQRFLHHIQL